MKPSALLIIYSVQFHSTVADTIDQRFQTHWPRLYFPPVVCNVTLFVFIYDTSHYVQCVVYFHSKRVDLQYLEQSFLLRCNSDQEQRSSHRLCPTASDPALHLPPPRHQYHIKMIVSRVQSRWQAYGSIGPYLSNLMGQSDSWVMMGQEKNRTISYGKCRPRTGYQLVTKTKISAPFLRDIKCLHWHT